MEKKEYCILSGASIHTPQGILIDSAIVIKNKIIHALISKTAINAYPSAEIIEFPSAYHIVPGFIDMHIHGACGKDVMDASFAALTEIGQALAAEGTTAYLATTMTAPIDEIDNVLSHVRKYCDRQQEVVAAEVLGVHLEGPFLSPDKVGAQRSDFILDPDIRQVEHWQKISNNIIKLVTLAPELANSLEFIDYLKQHNILASIGHSDATFSEAMNAIAAGCTHVTHLFNAMRGIHQREPGVVTAALLSETVMAELIVDGVHLHPAIVQLILKIKSSDKLVLVTDAMRAQCLGDGRYDLGGQVVTVKNNIARLADGTLAGSTLTMSAAVKNMLQFTACDFSDVIKMSAENPAKALGVYHRKGSLAEGKDADIVVLDERLNIMLTLCMGSLAKPR